MRFGTMAVLTLALTAASATAQEVSVPDYQGQYAEALLHSRLTGRMIRQAQERRRRAGTPTLEKAATVTPRQRAICRNKARLAIGGPRDKVRRLYALCAQRGL